MYIDPFAYENKSDEHKIESFPTKIIYYVLDEDPETGFAFGSKNYQFI